MNTKHALRTNLEALHLSTKPPAHQTSPKAPKPTKKPRTRPAAGRTPKTRATPARPTPKGSAGDEGDEGGDGDDAGLGEGAAPLAGQPEGVVALAGQPEGAAAVARMQADLDALPPHEVRCMSVHVPTAAAIALGALPRLLRLRDAIVALPGHPPDALAKLRDYALAASYAHALAQPRGEDETRLRALGRGHAPARALAPWRRGAGAVWPGRRDAGGVHSPRRARRRRGRRRLTKGFERARRRLPGGRRAGREPEVAVSTPVASGHTSRELASGWAIDLDEPLRTCARSAIDSIEVLKTHPP